MANLGFSIGDAIEGPALAITRETIREFAEASLDYNPLHLDDAYMETSFGKTQFGGIIMHGMTSFGLITRMLTDWALASGAVHRRLETRWLNPVRPGDTIRPRATIARVVTTRRSRWITFSVEVKNQRDETIATGEALAELGPLG
jgi:3-hydroxybutyryl-CoA dehydratase